MKVNLYCYHKVLKPISGLTCLHGWEKGREERLQFPRATPGKRGISYVLGFCCLFPSCSEQLSDIVGTSVSEAGLVSHAWNLCILEAEAGRLQAGTSLGCLGCSSHSSLHSEILFQTNKYIISNTHITLYIQKRFFYLLPSASSTAWCMGTMVFFSSQTRKPWALIVWLLPIRT